MSDTATAAALARPAAYRDRGQAAPASLFLAPATLLVLVMLLLPLLLLLRFSPAFHDVPAWNVLLIVAGIAVDNRSCSKQ